MSDGLVTKLIVAQGIVERDGRLLLVRNSWADGLHWGLPGGAMEQGGSLVDAVAREVKEETGLDVVMTGVAYIVEKRWQDTFGMFITCTTKETGGTLMKPEGDEIVDLGFFQIDEAIRMIDLRDIREPLDRWIQHRKPRTLHFLNDGQSLNCTG